MRCSRRWHGFHSAFTLAEAVAVMAVIITLTALLHPVLERTRKQLTQSTCTANLHQLAQAQMLYVDDYQGRLPHWFVSASLPGPPTTRFAGTPGGAPSLRYWPECFQPYLRDPSVLRDPELRRPWPLPTKGALADYTLWFSPVPLRYLVQVERPARRISLSDGWTIADRSVGWTGADCYRHREGMNASFWDGHVQSLPAGEFWRAQTGGGVSGLMLVAPRGS